MSLRARDLRSYLRFKEVGDGNRRQDSNDSDNDKKFD
jgi:hypothetical protein